MCLVRWGRRRRGRRGGWWCRWPGWPAQPSSRAGKTKQMSKDRERLKLKKKRDWKPVSRHSPPKDSRCHSLNYSLTCCCVDFQPRFSFKSDTMSLTPTGDVLLHWNSCKFESDSRRESFLDKNTISWQGHLELMWVVLNVYWSVVEADFFFVLTWVWLWKLQICDNICLAISICMIKNDK